MICPRCSSNQVDDVKFCTVCGANLQAVRQALEMREPEDRFNWNDTWLAEMFLSSEGHKKRRLALERELGVTPDVKRYNEIKAGVITSSVGIGVAIFLYVFMQGLILNSHVPHDAAVILSNVWVAGVIPFFVGLALITNGLFVSKKLVEIANRESAQEKLDGGSVPKSIKAADTNDFVSTPFSVTEQTTKHLRTSDHK